MRWWVRACRGKLLGFFDFGAHVDAVVGRNMGTQLRKLIGLFVVGVVIQLFLKIPYQFHERGLGGIGVLQLLHHLDDLVVLLLVVLALLNAVGKLLFHHRVNVHLLGDSVPHHFRDHRIGELAALFRVVRAFDVAAPLD